MPIVYLFSSYLEGLGDKAGNTALRRTGGFNRCGLGVCTKNEHNILYFTVKHIIRWHAFFIFASIGQYRKTLRAPAPAVEAFFVSSVLCLQQASATYMYTSATCKWRQSVLPHLLQRTTIGPLFATVLKPLGTTLHSPCPPPPAKWEYAAVWQFDGKTHARVGGVTQKEHYWTGKGPTVPGGGGGMGGRNMKKLLHFDGHVLFRLCDLMTCSNHVLTFQDQKWGCLDSICVLSSSWTTFDVQPWWQTGQASPMWQLPGTLVTEYSLYWVKQNLSFYICSVGMWMYLHSSKQNQTHTHTHCT